MEQYEELLNEWAEIDNGIMKDGVMINGLDPKWKEYDCRVLLLLKEGNQYGGDVRLWLKEDSIDSNIIANRKLGTIGKKRTIFQPLAYMLYGITYLEENQNYCEFNKIPNNADYIHTKIPFAYVEAKKTPGGASSNNKVIREYVKCHKDLLRRQIELLNPTIIICFDNYSCGFETLLTELTQIPIITSYHPSCIKSLEDKYNQVIIKYRSLQILRMVQESHTLGKQLWENKILYFEHKHKPDNKIVLDLHISPKDDIKLILKTRSEKKEDTEEVVNTLKLNGEWYGSDFRISNINKQSKNKEIADTISSILELINTHYPRL